MDNRTVRKMIKEWLFGKEWADRHGHTQTKPGIIPQWLQLAGMVIISGSFLGLLLYWVVVGGIATTRGMW